MSQKQEALSILNAAQMGVFSKLPTATLDEIHSAEAAMSKTLPTSLRDFYLSYANGIVFGKFKIAPVFSKINSKKSAESIVRINSADHSIWFNQDNRTIENFIVFCTEGSDICYCFKVNQGDVVWQWEQGWSQVKELDYDFWGWLNESLKQEKSYLFKD